MSTQGWIFLIVVGFGIAFYFHKRRLAHAPVNPPQESVIENQAPVPEDPEAIELKGLPEKNGDPQNR